jgi:probable O-glycosylation ligase (exosortase A-associated)
MSRSLSRASVSDAPVGGAPGGILYAWLLLVIFFEYARPLSFVPPLQAIPLNSILPLGLLIACVVASGLRAVKDIFSDGIAWWLLVYMIIISLGTLHADVTLRAFDTLKLCLGYIFLAFMIARICTTRERILGVFGTLIASHLFLLAMSPAVVLNPSQRNYIRGATFLGDGNDFALSLCILVPFSIAIARTRRTKFWRIAWMATSLLLVLAIVGTSSRGATLGLLSVTGFLLFFSKRRAPAVFAALIAGAVVVAYAPPAYFTRVKTVTSYEEDTSATARISAWKSGARMGLDNPILGVGAGNFPNNFPKYRGPEAPSRWMTAHSMYFLALGELGFPGFLTLLILVVGNIIISLRLHRRIFPQGMDQDAESPDAIVLLHIAAGGLGLAVAGAFLSVAYYPHIFIVGALAIASRATILAVRRGDCDELRGRRYRSGNRIRGRPVELQRPQIRRPVQSPAR